MSRQITWAEYAAERMKMVNVFNEVECFKAIKEIVNLYFSKDRDGLINKINELGAGSENEEVINSPLGGKRFGGWNVDYYCQPVEWDVFKNKKA